MKELPGKVASSCRVSFKTGQQPTYINGKLESCTRSDNCLLGKDRSSCCSCWYCSSLEIPQNPINAMEFLSRSWSPSSFDFQQIFLSRNKVLTHNQSNSDVENDEDADDKSSSQVREEKLEIEEVNEFSPQRSNTIRRVDDMLWMNSKNKKGWLRAKPLASLLRHLRAKNKEEIRLHTANVHAAISVTQLAAAIAGYAAKGRIGRAKDDILTINEGSVVEVNNMDNIMASAAALLATVCAETAESVGAQKIHVASAINSGLACQTTADVMTLMATTATCLRGASTLKSRAMANNKFPEKQELIEVKAQLSVITPSGHRRHTWVSIYSKHDQLTLSLQIKYLGVIPKTKEYKILHVMEKKMESQGHYSITLKSNDGNIKLIFKDENQSFLWTSNISNLLKMHS